VREAAEREGSLDLLVNNAGGAWRAAFADGGYENVRQTMEINFDAVVRLTEALLPLLRSSSPSSIVNVSSVAGRIGRPKVGAYAASKFALAGWTEALSFEEAPHGVHVGLVLPGFVATEGFPQKQLVGSARTRWMVSKPEKVAKAILAAGPGGKHEVHVPRAYGLVPRLRFLAPGLVRRAVRTGRF
jgi:short-subunit dehydrogenase